jgi:hypothetical protein
VRDEFNGSATSATSEMAATAPTGSTEKID